MTTAQLLRQAKMKEANSMEPKIVFIKSDVCLHYDRASQRFWLIPVSVNREIYKELEEQGYIMTEGEAEQYAHSMGAAGLDFGHRYSWHDPDDAFPAFYECFSPIGEAGAA